MRPSAIVGAGGVNLTELLQQAGQWMDFIQSLDMSAPIQNTEEELA